jgi:hypothetical protein
MNVRSVVSATMRLVLVGGLAAGTAAVRAQTDWDLNYALIASSEDSGVTASDTHGSATSTESRLTEQPIPTSPGSLDRSFDPTRGGELLGLESHRGSVQALALQGDGKVIVGGEFIGVNGAARHNLARLNADSSLDPGFTPSCSTDGRVLAVAVQPGGKVLLGGEFGFVNTVPRQYLARLNAEGTLDMGFDADGAQLN